MTRATAVSFVSATALILALAACSEPAPGGAARPAATASAAPAVAQPLPEPVEHPAAVAAVDPGPLEAPTPPALAQSADQAAEPAAETTPPAASEPAAPLSKRDAMVRAQVLLDRAHFSPGVIDGQDGGNLKNAVAAFETAHNLPVDGQLDDQVLQALSADTQPVTTDYVITAEDEKGPFIGKIPTDYVELAKLPHVGFTTPLQELAERFHMDEALLKALNPGADFSAAGTKLTVANVGPEKLAGTVARIEVDKTSRQVRAYGEDDHLMAVYPATVGSTERPAPSGEWAVRTLAPNPTYTYDPSRLTFGKASQGKLTIQSGPNNPVGSTWIDLTKDTYGIHGTPDPRLVGKTASHGCVRLTNWDAHQLGAAVKKGTKVVFMGEATEAKKKA